MKLEYKRRRMLGKNDWVSSVKRGTVGLRMVEWSAILLRVLTDAQIRRAVNVIPQKQ